MTLCTRQVDVGELDRLRRAEAERTSYLAWLELELVTVVHDINRLLLNASGDRIAAMQ